MLALHHRLAVAGVAAATAIAVPAAALASGPGSSSGKPSPPPAAGAVKSPGAAHGAQGPSMAAALAAQLGIGTGSAQRALDQLESMTRGGVAPGSPAFAVIARELGVSPDRLVAALEAAKQSLGQANDATARVRTGPAGSTFTLAFGEVFTSLSRRRRADVRKRVFERRTLLPA